MFNQDEWWLEDQKVELDEIEHSFWMNRETRKGNLNGHRHTKGFKR